jgi:predicted TIM-barrel fold metal-dependent hydrolase
MRSPEEGIADLEEIAALGLRGVMMPGLPAGEDDYDSPAYDEFWEAAVESRLPLSFHILTTRAEHTRGPKMNTFLSVVRGCQDIMGMLVLGGVFERHPQLKVVCVEADAGWVPHFMYRMDHAYKRHRFWLPPGQELTRLPSEWFADNIYVTFQDDWTAFRFADAMNWRHLLWANDFPHSDSTWPWSQEMLAEHTADLSPEQRQAILSTNTAELYGIDVTALVSWSTSG